MHTNPVWASSKQLCWRTDALPTSCESVMQLKEKLSYVEELLDGLSIRLEANTRRATEHNLGHTVFNSTENDNKLTPSIEDTFFLKIKMSTGTKHTTGALLFPSECQKSFYLTTAHRRSLVSPLCIALRTENHRWENNSSPSWEESSRTITPNQLLRWKKECWYLPCINIVMSPQKI